MKRFLTIILAALMLLSLAACGGKDDDVTKIGVLEMDMLSGHGSHIVEAHKETAKKYDNDAKNMKVQYDKLSAALMDLANKKISSLAIEESMAKYIVARNENMEYESFEVGSCVNYSMMTMESNKEVYDILNNAIKDMKADGTLDSLIANELKAYIENDPVAKDLPHFAGAKTIKIGVTGDVPPMDYVASNGTAAGFNVALLTEIANRAQVNIELVQIETGARAMALSAGNVDAVFWSRSITCADCDLTWTEKPENTVVTESYYSDNAAKVVLKSDK